MPVRKKFEVKLDYVEIGQRIQRLRVKKGYTQRYVSEMTGMSLSHVSNIETGKQKHL